MDVAGIAIFDNACLGLAGYKSKQTLYIFEGKN
jgi:hypothetical protein